MSGAFEEALEAALKHLARRDRFESEIRAHLSGYPEEVRDQVVGHLTRKRILDDGRAAAALVRSREGRRAIGISALRQELQLRGASAQVIEALPIETTELQRALGVLESKFSRRPSDRARAGRLLARRGFEEEDIDSALEAFFGSSAPSEGE